MEFDEDDVLEALEAMPLTESVSTQVVGHAASIATDASVPVLNAASSPQALHVGSPDADPASRDISARDDSYWGLFLRSRAGAQQTAMQRVSHSVATVSFTHSSPRLPSQTVDQAMQEGRDRALHERTTQSLRAGMSVEPLPREESGAMLSPRMQTIVQGTRRASRLHPESDMEQSQWMTAVDDPRRRAFQQEQEGDEARDRMGAGDYRERSSSELMERLHGISRRNLQRRTHLRTRREEPVVNPQVSSLEDMDHDTLRRLAREARTADSVDDNLRTYLSAISSQQQRPRPPQSARASRRIADRPEVDEGLEAYLSAVLQAVEEAVPEISASGVHGVVPSAASLADAISNLQTFKADMELADSCSICLDTMGLNQELARLPCGHCFHNACIVTWLPSSLTCPLCKRPPV